jgi:protein-tyrosine phosphatase
VIDTHCHLLPAIDDGPSSPVDSVRMARRLFENGVHLVVCTPHHSTVYPTDVAVATSKLERLRGQLAALEVPIEIRLAAELSITRLLLLSPSEIAARTLGPRHLLFELRRDTPVSQISAAVERLDTLALVPVLAHPERCLVVQRDPALLDHFRSRGCLTQIVAPSLTEESTSPIATTAWTLLESGAADLVASDAHRPHGIRVRLRALADLLATRYGQDASDELLEHCPARIVGVPRPPIGDTSNNRPART